MVEEIETTEYFGDGLPVRTGISPQCQGESPQHFACHGIKIEEDGKPRVCVCKCHVLAKVI